MVETRPGQPHRLPRRGRGSVFAPGLPRLRQGLQPAENSRLRPRPDLPKSHLGCSFGGTSPLSCRSLGPTGRTGPTAVRSSILGRGAPNPAVLQSKFPRRGKFDKFDISVGYFSTHAWCPGRRRVPGRYWNRGRPEKRIHFGRQHTKTVVNAPGRQWSNPRRSQARPIQNGGKHHP